MLSLDNDRKEIESLIREKHQPKIPVNTRLHQKASDLAKKHLEKIHLHHKWDTPSHANATGADIEGRLNGKLTVHAEVKTMEPKKGKYGAKQKEEIEKDLWTLQHSPASSKYFFVLDDSSRTAIMDKYQAELQESGITVLTIIPDCL